MSLLLKLLIGIFVILTAFCMWNRLVNPDSAPNCDPISLFYHLITGLFDTVVNHIGDIIGGLISAIADAGWQLIENVLDSATGGLL